MRFRKKTQYKSHMCFLEHRLYSNDPYKWSICHHTTLGFTVTLNCDDLMHCVLFVSEKKTDHHTYQFTSITNKQKNNSTLSAGEAFIWAKPLFAAVHLDTWNNTITQWHVFALDYSMFRMSKLVNVLLHLYNTACEPYSVVWWCQSLKQWLSGETLV